MQEAPEKEMSQWPTVVSFTLSCIATIAALVMFGWRLNVIIACIGLSASWFYTGRTMMTYTIWLMMKDIGERKCQPRLR